MFCSIICDICPIGNNCWGIYNLDAKNIGELIKTARKKQGFTQAEAAGYLNVGIRFLSELENGKATVQLGKVLQVLEGLGYETLMVPKSKRKIINYVKKNLSDG